MWFNYCIVDAFVSALMALYGYSKPVSKGLPHPESPLSKILFSATIKAASKYDSYALEVIANVILTMYHIDSVLNSSNFWLFEI